MENPTYPAQIAQAYARMAELPPDPWRPAYHLSPLSGTLADPDGLCQVGGVYHIFYVTNPLGCLTTQRTSCVWGHYSTRDFVHYATPVVVNETLWGLGTSLLPAIYGRMGTDVLAAVTISRNVENIANVFAFGVAGAAAVWTERGGGGVDKQGRWRRGARG